MLATQLESYKNRRCSSCTVKDQDKYGCEKDIRPFNFDGEKITRCPLRPFKEDPGTYSEYFQLYSFREKNVMAEPGGFYDQPAVYIEIMSEMDSAMSDAMNPKKHSVATEEEDKVAGLQAIGINISKKK